MTTTTPFAHLVDAAEAFQAGDLAADTPFRVRHGHRFEVQICEGPDGAPTPIVVPLSGDRRCYPIADVLGRSRVAIIRTAAIRDQIAAR